MRLKIVPIIIKGVLGNIRVLAFFDEGSTVSLLDAEVAKQLGINGKRDTLYLDGLNDTPLGVSIQRSVGFSVKACNGDAYYKVNNVYVASDLRLPRQSLTADFIRQNKHLQGLDLHTFSWEKPKLLLGQDNFRLIVTRELRCNTFDGPAASRTLLGWVVHGFGGISTSNSRCLSVYGGNWEVVENTSLTEIHALIKDYFSFETLGIKNIKRIAKKEERALNILNSTTCYKNGRWKTGLSWEHDKRDLPDNYNGALSRLKALEARLDRDPKYADLYYREMERLIREGYAVEVSFDGPSGRVIWYVPHFGVTNVNKPNKVRLVFDAAYIYRGISLNNQLLAGPDLIKSLFSVLLSFRVGAVALKSDIRDMFMRVGVREEDQDAQRFLWRGRDRTGKPKVYKMSCLLFGSKCSPCSAIYTLNKNAECYSREYPIAADSIIHDTYVDDYLKSVNSIDEARDLKKAVTLINSKAGFEMLEWESNVPELRSDKRVKSNNTVPSATVNFDAGENEKVLGLQWDTNKDIFSFNFRLDRVTKNIIQIGGAPTKRQMLRVIMSIYDPLGFLNPFTIRSKILLQNVWRRGTGWDEKLCDEGHSDWKQ